MGLLNRIRESGKPPVQVDAEPLSVSGRGHVDGFLQLDELNISLQGRQGLEVFDRMYRTDADTRQVIHLVANPIQAGTWEVEPTGGSEATQEAMDDASFVRWALFENMSPNLRGHLSECLPVLFRSGFAPFEKVWEVTEYEGENVTVPRSLQLRLPRTIYRWKQDRYNGLEAIEQYLPVPRAQVIAGPNVTLPGDPVLEGPDQSTTGYDDSSVGDPSIVTDTRTPDYRQRQWLPTSNLIYYRVGAEGDNWEGTSLLRPAYKHWYLKDAIERMDAIAQEKEALGTPMCYPPLGATPDQLEAMETVMQNIRTNGQGYAIMPGPKAAGTGGSANISGGWLVEYLAPGHNGTGRDPSNSLKYHTDKIAAAFIAEFIRLGHSLTGGNRGLGETQMDPFLVGVEAIAGLIEDIINDQLVAPIMAYNRPNATAAPRVRMSLIDATTLSQLADFILKLVQVGALLPDQGLEDFLRARADLPPADAKAVSGRGELDDSLRREIVMGKNGNADSAPAGTNGPAGSTTGGSAAGTKGTDNKDKATPAPASDKPSSAHDALTRKAISKATLDAYREGMSLSADDYPPFSPGTERLRWRPQAFYELNCDLDGIEDHFDTATTRLADLCGPTMLACARTMAESYPKRVISHPDLQSHIQHVLDDAYGYGQQTAGGEIERHHRGLGGLQLAKALARNRATVKARAQVATRHVLETMTHAIAHGSLQDDDAATNQRAAEKAGMAALARMGRAHVPAAFNQGRSDRILDAQDSSSIKWGVRYTAILDKNTCDECHDADDGQVRRLDDPVRLANQPPNPHCESVASGNNQCRCFEIPEPMDGTSG